MEKDPKFYRNKLRELEDHQTKLHIEDNTLLHEEAPLRANLTTALEKFAEGDQTQDRIIDEIKKKLKPIERRREGIASLLERGRGEISRNIELLKEAEQKEKAELAFFLNDMRAKRAEAAKLRVEKAPEELCNKYLDFVRSIGDAQFDALISGVSLPDNYISRIMNFPQSMGFKKSPYSGIVGDFGPFIWPVFESKQNLTAADIAKQRDAEDVTAWTETWYAQKNKGE